MTYPHRLFGLHGHYAAAKLIALLLLTSSSLAAEELTVTGVQASSATANEALNTLDGDLSTHWTAGEEQGWISYDIGQTSSISAVSLAWHEGQSRSVQFEVQASLEGETWTTVLRGQSSGTTDQPETYELNGEPARYLRIVDHSASPDSSSTAGLSEARLFGSAADVNASSSSLSSDSASATDTTTADSTSQTTNTSDTTTSDTEPPTLDVDGDGQMTADTDGLLIVRYLLDVRGSDLTDGATGEGATRVNPSQIVEYLDGARDTMLDVDGNGQADALTDGVLIQRHLADYQGDSLTEGALGKDATRSDAEQISQTLKEYESTDNGSDTAPERSSFLGMNLSRFRYYSAEWVFVDAMKRARNWIPQTPGSSKPWNASGDPHNVELEFTENGWPILDEGEAAGTLIYRGVGEHYPAGTYTCTYNGTGKIAFGFSAEVIERRNHLIKLRVEPHNSGIYMRIDESDPNDPVRDIRLWLPGYAPGEDKHGATFHPMFKERLRPFSVIRFMDWQETNGRDVVHWEDRTSVDHYSYSGQGMPVEMMVDLCNELGATPWFCMPHKASDEYVRKFAEIVRDRLHPNTKIYVEYSNELWNTRFEQAKWLRDRAGDWGKPQIREWATQAERDFAIWRAVFGDQSDRIVRVAAGQAANAWVAGKLTGYLDGAYDAIAVAAYFKGDGDTVDEVVDDARNEIEGRVTRGYQDHADLARRRSEELGRPIPLISYEGGQHITAEGQRVDETHPVIAVQDDPRMYDLYIENMLAFEKAGGSLFTAFNYVSKPGKWGSWGHLEHQSQAVDNALKFKALIDYPRSDERFQMTAND